MYQEKCSYFTALMQGFQIFPSLCLELRDKMQVMPIKNCHFWGSGCHYQDYLLCTSYSTVLLSSISNNSTLASQSRIVFPLDTIRVCPGSLHWNCQVAQRKLRFRGQKEFCRYMLPTSTQLINVQKRPEKYFYAFSRPLFPI